MCIRKHYRRELYVYAGRRSTDTYLRFVNEHYYSNNNNNIIYEQCAGRERFIRDFFSPKPSIRYRFFISFLAPACVSCVCSPIHTIQRYKHRNMLIRLNTNYDGVYTMFLRLFFIFFFILVETRRKPGSLNQVRRPRIFDYYWQFHHAPTQNGKYCSSNRIFNILTPLARAPMNRGGRDTEIAAQNDIYYYTSRTLFEGVESRCFGMIWKFCKHFFLFVVHKRFWVWMIMLIVFVSSILPHLSPCVKLIIFQSV